MLLYRFLFGACCQLQGTVESPLVVEHELSQSVQTNHAAAQSYETYGHQQHPYQSYNNNNNDGISYNEIKLEDNKNSYRPQTNNHFAGTIVNNVYDSSLDIDSNIGQSNGDLNENSVSAFPEKFFVDRDSVMVSSPSPEYGGSSTTTPTHYITTITPNTLVRITQSPIGSTVSQQQVQTFSQELPTHIPTGPYDALSTDSTESDDAFTADGFSDVSEKVINEQSTDFTHSGITHPGVDSVLLDTDTGYGTAQVDTFATERLTINPTEHTQSPSTTTERTHKFSHSKPGFRPKPTKIGQTANGNKYVLVQTINHDNSIKNDLPPKPQATMSDNDIESIESIILMLNDTKTGPQYSSADSSTEIAYGTTFNQQDPSTTLYGIKGSSQTTSNIEYDKYGPSSYYITTKLPSSIPKLPSTSYVYSPQPTRRPIQVQSTISSSYGAVTPVDGNRISTTTTPPPTTSIHHTQNSKRPILITAASFKPQQIVTKLPTTNYFIESSTTKLPNVNHNPVTVTTTKRPTTIQQKKTKRPNVKVTTTSKPSTVYVSVSTVAPTKKPKQPPSKIGPLPTSSTKHPTTQPSTYKRNVTDSPIVLVFRPTYSTYDSTSTQSNTNNDYVKPLYISTDTPVPTVLITPKPTANSVTTSTWAQHAGTKLPSTPLIKIPSTSYVYSPIVTIRPGTVDVTPSVTSGYGSSVTYAQPTSNKRPISISDSSYYGSSSTLKPSIHQSITTISSNLLQDSTRPTSQPYPVQFGSSASYGPIVSQDDFVEYSTLKDEYYTSPNDLNNFPPVRNPNLNLSSTFVNGVTVEDYDISTPEFIEDEQLNDKMGLLVSKIVESLQGNFDQLADVVYDDIADTTGTKQPGKRPTTSTKKPSQKATTKKPTTGKPTTKKPGSTTIKKPSTNNRVTTTKKPVSAAASSSQTPKRTTKKPPTTLSITTKKPVTKVCF